MVDTAGVTKAAPEQNRKSLPSTNTLADIASVVEEQCGCLEGEWQIQESFELVCLASLDFTQNAKRFK